MMSKIYIMLPLLFFFNSCQAQQKDGEIDSLSLLSRDKADKVLSQFNSLYGSKILYSLRDEHYYVIIQKQDKYQEYYVSLDSTGSVNKIRSLESRKENRKMLSQAFMPEKYHSGFITSLPEATYVRGVPSYFVLIGMDGKRYGEYNLSSLTLPIPIAEDIYAYLIKRLIEEISSEK